MKLDISSIRDIRGEAISFRIEQQFIPDSEIELLFIDPVKVNGKVTNTGNGFLVEMSLCFHCQGNCSRCLEKTEVSQDINVVDSIITNDSESDLTIHINGDLIDLTDYINEQVLLALPMKLLCAEDCRGLCSGCGQNLNTHDCQCSRENINPNFEKLRSLLSPEGGGVNGKSKEQNFADSKKITTCKFKDDCSN